MTVSVFPASLKVARQNKLENITLRGFGGGWNTVETDLQMESTYLVKVRNFRRTPGGTQKIRYGSKWLADLTDVASGRIVDMIYFSASLICVLSTGNIVAVSGDGTKEVIWSTAIAAALPGAPAGWSGNLDTISFVPYKNELIIHNGVDKPITINRNLDVTYLQDLGTGSNINVPIGKYGCVVSNYHCIAGITKDPSTGDDLPSPTFVYISAVGTAGTFPFDPVPNDAISVDVGAYAPQGAIDIRGIAGFRANLLVYFQDQTVIAKLGTYSAATPPVHQPFFPDTMPTFGLLGHRCVAPVENDLLFAGLGGMASARRNLLSVSGTLESQSLSERIEPAYRGTIGNLTDDQQLKECFMIYDKLSHDMLLITPTGRTFVYSFNTKLRYSAWSEYSGLNIQCGCTSFLGRLFYADGLRVYLHGNKVFEGEEFFRDRVNDRNATWANSAFYVVGYIAFDPVTNESYICQVDHVSSASPTTFVQDRTLNKGRWLLFEGNSIDFELELPWLDSKNPMQIKQLRFVSMATKGNAQFVLSAFVDNLYKNHEGDVVFGPAASMEFIGNEAVGFGFDAGPYGGGRRSGDPRLWKFPCKFKTLKVALTGDEAGDLELVNLSFLFSRGKYRR
jgi:hypothetical protein